MFGSRQRGGVTEVNKITEGECLESQEGIK